MFLIRSVLVDHVSVSRTVPSCADVLNDLEAARMGSHPSVSIGLVTSCLKSRVHTQRPSWEREGLEQNRHSPP